MKTERKHELQTNVLADWLGQHMDQARPYAKNVAIAIGIALVAVIAFAFVQHQKTVASGVSWEEYVQAITLRSEADRSQKIDRIFDLHPTENSGMFAGLNWAEIKLRDGCDRLFTNREIARKELDDAKKRFMEIEAASKGQPDIHQFAMYGLAQTLEALGDTKGAIEKFRQISAQWPGSAIGNASKARADFLSTPSIEQFYDWFGKQTPRVQPPFGNRDFLPPDFGDLSDRPDRAPGNKNDLGAPFGGFGKDLDLDGPINDRRTKDKSPSTDVPGADDLKGEPKGEEPEVANPPP